MSQLESKRVYEYKEVRRLRDLAKSKGWKTLTSYYDRKMLEIVERMTVEEWLQI